MIAGGYTPPGVGFERGYIYNEKHPKLDDLQPSGCGFPLISKASLARGRDGEYNLVADWFAIDGTPTRLSSAYRCHGSQTWIDLAVPGASLTSANSIFESQAIGIYIGVPPDHQWFYSHYSRNLQSDPQRRRPQHQHSQYPALSGGTGDDIVNDGIIHTTAANSSGISSGTYGVITNNGSITVTGPGSAAVEMNGLYGTLLNKGSIV